MQKGKQMNENNRLYKLDNIKAVAGEDEVFIKSMIVLFLEKTLPQGEELVSACAEENWAAVYFLAHKIKATIILMDIVPAIESIRIIETNAKTATNLETLPVLIRQIATIISAVAAQMKEDFLL